MSLVWFVVGMLKRLGDPVEWVTFFTGPRYSSVAPWMDEILPHVETMVETIVCGYLRWGIIARGQ